MGILIKAVRSRRFLALLTLQACLPLAAADLNGIWKAHGSRPDGSPEDIYFVLHQDGAALTGKVVYPTRQLTIEKGTRSADRITFDARGRRESSVVESWSGEIAGSDLVLERASSKPAVKLTAHAAPANALDPAQKLPVPSPKDLSWNKLAQTPPMGWNSWNLFAGRVDDKTVREIADAMVRTGMRDAGYIYVNIDDTWQGERDAQGRIQPNHKFPDMAALAAYVHGKGMLIGLYSSPGPQTCAGYEGSYGHETQDVETYTQWGFDYLKYDWCSAGRIYQDADLRAVYQKMGEALAAAGRPIIFSLCEYGRGDVWTWGPKVGGNLWRTTGDIEDKYESMAKIGFGQSELAPYAGPGHWNDPDMLEVGNGGMSNEEYRTHMSLWAILAAPLLAGNDVRHMSQQTMDILLNKEVIAIDQDKLGHQGARRSKNGDLEIWTKELSGGDTAVGLFNRGSESAEIKLNWRDFAKTSKFKVRDTWKHEYVRVAGDNWTTSVPSHGVVLLRVKPQ